MAPFWLDSWARIDYSWDMEVVPSILESSVDDFKASLEKVVGFAQRIQVDFNDGTFAGFTSVLPGDIGGFIADRANAFFFEGHLMVQKPFEYIPKLKELGFRKIIVQFEIEENIREGLEELSQMDVLVGLGIGPETPLLDIEPLADLLDTITVMDIEPGKQGQKFLAQELQKIRELKGGNFPGEVQADGAINLETAPEIIEAGADTLVVGSYIVKSPNPQEAYENLVGLIK